MSDYWKDFIPAMRATRLGDCTDSDPQLNAAWLGWQARDAEIERLRQQLVEAQKDVARMDWLEDTQRCYHVTVQSQPHGDIVADGKGALRVLIDATIAQQKDQSPGKSAEKQ